jgi:hypothetical protein
MYVKYKNSIYLKTKPNPNYVFFKNKSKPKPARHKKIYPAMLYLPSFLALESLSSYATRIQNIPRDSFV